jgi:predicted PurR-regulated permease PerM
MKVSLGGVLLLGSVVVALLLLNELSPMMTPFFLGALLAYLGDPWVDRLERWRIGRGLASGLVFLAIALLVAVTLMLFIPALAHEASELLKGLPATLVWLQARLAPLLTPWIGVDAGGMDVRGLAEEYLGDWEQSSDVLGYLLGQLTASGKAIFGGVMTLALTPVVAFYLMRDWDSIIERLDNLIPRSQLVVIRSLVRAGDDMLAAFIRGQLLVMIFLGLFYSIGLGLLGVEMALIIGLVAGLASVVPYLGFILGLALASLTAAYQFQDWLHPAYVLGIFLVGQILEGSVLTPWLVGDKIGLHPVAVIFAVLAGGQLFGFSGVLLALPVTAVLMVLVRFSLQQYLQSQWYQGSAESSSVTVDEPAESEPQALTTPGSEASEAKEEGPVTELESNPAIDGRGVEE